MLNALSIIHTRDTRRSPSRRWTLKQNSAAHRAFVPVVHTGLARLHQARHADGVVAFRENSRSSVGRLRLVADRTFSLATGVEGLVDDGDSGCAVVSRGGDGHCCDIGRHACWAVNVRERE